MTEDKVREILTEQRDSSKSDKIVIHAGKLRRYFPDEYSDEQILGELYQILEETRGEKG